MKKAFFSIHSSKLYSVSLLIKTSRCLHLHFFYRSPLFIKQKPYYRKRTSRTSPNLSMSSKYRWNIFEILLNQPENRLNLSSSDWFISNRTFVWIQINGKMVYTIWFRFDLISIWKDFSVCTSHGLPLAEVESIIAKLFFTVKYLVPVQRLGLKIFSEERVNTIIITWISHFLTRNNPLFFY